MFIQTEQTPNPATLKFLPGEPVMATGTANYTSSEAAVQSHLAARLFAIEEVEGVFLGQDFISVTKASGGGNDDEEWQRLKPAVLGAIMEHFMSGQPVMAAVANASDGADGDSGENANLNEADAEIIGQIKELIETRVRPAVAQDGGDIVFHGYDKGIVSLHMQGACAGCPSSTITLKNGIENMLRHYVPEVQEVRAV